MIRPSIILVSLLFSSPASSAYEWMGTVIGISDGDTMTALSQDKQPIKIRLIEIDAPEHDQSFGTKSKQSLSQICYGKKAVIREKGKDKYGRTLGRVFCDGVDANAEQVRQGMAWAYQKYLTDPGIAQLEKKARSSRTGLWAEKSAIPPWEFRHPEKTRNTLANNGKRPSSYPESETFSCQGKNAYCKSMTSCAEAMFYLKHCGAEKLDRDGDGVPCENLCK